MENWMQKYENNKEKTEEDTLQIQLTELIDLVDNAKYYEESKTICKKELDSACFCRIL